MSGTYKGTTPAGALMTEAMLSGLGYIVILVIEQTFIYL